MFPLLTNARVLLSALIITGAVAAIGSGATGAFFSDTEVSTGNAFAAGAIDLKVDNDSYYNGNRCVNVEADQNDPANWQWAGPNPYPVPGTPCTTSWPLDDLSNGHLFFNFLDLKPDDDGEDTISLHVENDAWACMELSLTENDDNSTTEPEGIVDPEAVDAENDNWDGELAQNIQFFWWADDGDNVLETDETGSIMQAPMSLYALSTTSPFRVALADSVTNVWDEVGAVPANDTRYIAKAWCFGTLTPAALEPGEGGPQDRIHGGYTCDGTGLDNRTQTDSSIVNVQFIAEQARHNANFLCPSSIITRLTLIKNVEGGTAADTDFMLSADGLNNISGVEGDAAITSAVIVPGAYDLSETNLPDYTASTWVCEGGSMDDGDTVTIAAGQSVTCAITNTYVPQCLLTGANLVTNGGFETPEVTAAQNWDIFDSVAGGWTVDWRADVPASFGGSTRPTPAHLELHENVMGAAFEGDQYTELDSDWNGHTGSLSGEPASVTIYQDIPTEVGATYAISFNWAARPSTVAAENRVRVEWDGIVVHDTGTLADPNAGITWIAVGPIAVTATDATTRVQFTDLGVANSNGTFLDNVSVVKTSCGPGGATVAVSSPPPAGLSSFLLEGFGTGGDDNDIDNWDEEGTDGDAGTRSENGTGADGGVLSPNGGRFALIDDNEWICRSINATQLHTMQLDYYWMGDNDAEDGESATVQYSTTSCTAGLVTLATHELDDGDAGAAAWASNGGIALPASLNGTTFFLRFTNGNQSQDDEDFRVDGVSISGTPTI